MIYFLDIEKYGEIPDLLILINQLNFLVLILIFLVCFFGTYFLINSVLERKN